MRCFNKRRLLKRRTANRVPVAIPIGNPTRVPVAIPIEAVIGLNGPMYLNDRVTTFYSRLDKWCNGIITDIHSNNRCSITYHEDGFSVSGDASVVRLIEKPNIMVAVTLPS